MRYERLAVALVLVGFAMSIGCASAPKKFYVGGSAGIADNKDFVSAKDESALSMIEADESDTTLSVVGGWEFHKNVGVEAGYHDYGDTSFTAESDGTGDSWKVPGMVGTDFEADAWSLTTIGRLPVSDRWTLYARLGVNRWSTTETFTEPGPVVSVDKNSGTDATYGAGVEWDVRNENDWVYRAEYGHTKMDDDGDNVDTVTVGGVWKF